MRLRPSLLALGFAAALLVSLAWPLPDAAAPSGAVVSTSVTDRVGGLLREVRPDGRGRPVPLDAVGPDVIAALVATEDRRFWRHPGIDPLAIGRAAWHRATGGPRSGGSTLTMQVARSLRGRTDRGLADKFAEAHLAVRLELRLTKREILALWLNRVPFGNGAHGIESAARLYFGKGARDLTTAEAAFLVGLPQSPSRYDPFRHPERAHARQRRVLDAMEREDRITPAERARLAALPLPLAAPDRSFRAPHFVEFVLADADGSPAEVRTTLDATLQSEAEHVVRAHLAVLDASVTAAAAVVLDNRTGDVLAYVGSPDYWDARGGQNDGVRMLRQPGSTVKPFTYGLALASGRYSPASILPDLDVQILEAGGAFSPENYDRRFHGPVPLRQALASSYNVPAVVVAREIGPEALLRAYRRAGLTSLHRPADHYGVGLTLGNGEVSLLELARAYAGLGRGGTLPPVRPVRWTRSVRGDTLRAPEPRFEPNGLPPAVAYLLTDILSDPEARAPGFGRGGPLELPFPSAVKTGTSKDYRDNWAVGTTPTHTVAVWAGNFDGSPMRWVSGVSGAGPILHALLRTLGSGGDFARPAGIAEAVVCPQSGLRPGAHCPSRAREVFLVGTVPTDTCDVHRRVALDRRTGLLADADTPADAVDDRLFAVYAPEYHDWMRAQGLPLPPTVSRAETEAKGTALVYSDRLRVQYPASGTVFHLDPVLRADYQRLTLRGAADADVLDLEWWVDGERLPGGIDAVSWALRPGRHRIELRGIGPEGQRLRSRPADVLVRS
ncbi:MAG: penicillin-binding protein 1C [Rhodothermales bacterium]